MEHVKDRYEALIWLCGNYQWSLSLKTTVTLWELRRTANHTDIWKLGLGYEMPCGPVDGMNPVKLPKQ
jgi:TPP-dependent pyruvate/acetoin dehydrogenase alpha subunit